MGAGIVIGHLFFHKPSTSQQVMTNPNTIEIKNYAYAPEKLTVKKGTTITWKNVDLVPHTVTMEDKEKEGPNSKLLNKDETYSYTFTETGTFAYYCDPHPYMKATIEVVE